MDKTFTDNLSRLRNTHLEPFDLQHIDSIERAAKLAEFGKKVKTNPFFRALVLNVKSRVDEINHILQNDRAISDIDRAKLFERRDAYEWFVNLFEALEGRVDAMTREIAGFVQKLEE